MSNTRKLRQLGSDPEREQRHMAWLNRDNNSATLTQGAQAAYDAHGRGFWFAAQSYATLDETCTTVLDGSGFTPLIYVPEARIPRLPGRHIRDVVARTVATYDPARQNVVVFDDEGWISVYQVEALSLN